MSDQSDALNAHPAAADHPSPSLDPEDDAAYINGGHDFAESSHSPDENNASDDADFDMDDDVVNPQSDGVADARSISGDSQTSNKRKATLEEDDYIKANPELYGLRRSVCNIVASYHEFQC